MKMPIAETEELITYLPAYPECSRDPGSVRIPIRKRSYCY
jgi:hypothetical protein